MHTFFYYFMLFIMYSFIGWLIETLFCWYKTKKLVNRGFLVGPICPIYGYGCLLIIILLSRYVDESSVLFVMAMVLCSMLEYFTSYVMEKLFKARWWDYSDKLFNINGRICLENIVAFGLLGLLVMYLVNPFVVSILDKFSSNVLYIVGSVFLVMYLVDNVISFHVIKGFKNVASSVSQDSTEEITKKVRELLTIKGGLYKRLVSAFNFQASERLLRELGKKVKDKVDKAKVVIETSKEKSKEQRRKIKEEYNLKIYQLKEMILKEKENKKEKLKKIK